MKNSANNFGAGLMGALLACALVSITATPVAASALACTSTSIPADLFPPLEVVVGILTVTATNPLCDSGTAVVSFTPPCPAAVGPAFGEYCGPTIPAASKAVCWWVPGPGPHQNELQLYAGFDWDGDGNVLVTSGEGPLYGPIPIGVPWYIPNTGPAGRVIAYPTVLGAAAINPSLTTLVKCI